MTQSITPSTPISGAETGSPASSEKSTRLLLVCHGEGLYDRFSNLSRNLVTDEGGLSAAGWEQANTLAAWLQDHEAIDFLASGSQLRSRLTGQRISQILHIPLHIARTFPNHLFLGADTGETRATADLPQPTTENNGTVTADSTPGNDTDDPTGTAAQMTSFFHQVQAALAELLADHWGETIVLVTHSQVIAALISTFFGTQNLAIQIDATSLSELRWSKGRWELVYLNRHEHIPCPRRAITASPVRRPENGEEHTHLESVRALFNRVASVYARNKQETDRQRVQDLLRFANLPEEMEILDVGTGPGTLALALVKEGAKSVLGIDISEAMLEQAEYLRLSTLGPAQAARLGFRLGPAHNLPFIDERFDAVVCRLVLQYLTQPSKSIEEMVRVLKPGGTLILAEILSDDDPVKRATQNAIEERRDAGHVAARSVEQYRKLMTNASLVVERVETQSFDRELDEWLSSLDTGRDDREAVREMLEAGVETDAAGINARQVGETLVFEQRMIYLKAVKP